MKCLFTEITAFIPALAGTSGQLRGTAETFSAPVYQRCSPSQAATWKAGTQSRYNLLMVSGCAHTSAYASHLL